MPFVAIAAMKANQSLPFFIQPFQKQDSPFDRIHLKNGYLLFLLSIFQVARTALSAHTDNIRQIVNIKN